MFCTDDQYVQTFPTVARGEGRVANVLTEENCNWAPAAWVTRWSAGFRVPPVLDRSG